MGILSKESLLGASDLREEEVELPAIGGSVRVRGLAAGYTNEALSEALEVVTTAQGQKTRVNTAKLEALQVLHGLVEPKLQNIKEAEALSKQLGPSWRLIVTKIDDLSGVDKDAIEKAEATFPNGGSGETGSGGTGEGGNAEPESVVDDPAAGEGAS